MWAEDMRGPQKEAAWLVALTQNIVLRRHRLQIYIYRETMPYIDLLQHTTYLAVGWAQHGMRQRKCSAYPNSTSNLHGTVFLTSTNL